MAFANLTKHLKNPPKLIYKGLRKQTLSSKTLKVENYLSKPPNLQNMNSQPKFNQTLILSYINHLKP